jgi:hypothetical protein
MPGLQKEVIRMLEATIAMEATRAEAVCDAVAYTQEVAAAREKVKASIKEAEARATSIEREA